MRLKAMLTSSICRHDRGVVLETLHWSLGYCFVGGDLSPTAASHEQ